MNIVVGVEEGRLQGIPWQSLPLIRAFVKERLALAAFSVFHCSSGESLARNGSLNRVLGCLCTGWKEGGGGISALSEQFGDAALQQELEYLRCILSAISGGNQKSHVCPLYR